MNSFKGINDIIGNIPFNFLRQQMLKDIRDKIIVAGPGRVCRLMGSFATVQGFNSTAYRFSRISPWRGAKTAAGILAVSV